MQFFDLLRINQFFLIDWVIKIHHVNLSLRFLHWKYGKKGILGKFFDHYDETNDGKTDFRDWVKFCYLETTKNDPVININAEKSKKSN